MRPYHFVRPTTAPLLEPLCGDWGYLDTHWTEDAGAVTCPACLEALRRQGRPAGTAEAPAPRA